jgi:hypothetical protein
MQKLVFLFLGLFFFPFGTFSQASLKDSSIFITEVKMSYAAFLPGADLADRFGFANNLGLDVTLKTKSEWTFGLQGTFIFGENIREDNILDAYMQDNGSIINMSGGAAVVLMMERGFTLVGDVGYLLPVWGPNKNSGLLFSFGAGWMQHRIRIEANRDAVPQIQGGYADGYDRLTGGFTTHQFLGYQYLSNRRMINFFAGVEFYQGYTVNLRGYNYDQAAVDNERRLDLIYSFRAGWILPLYRRAAREIY